MLHPMWAPMRVLFFAFALDFNRLRMYMKRFNACRIIFKLPTNLTSLERWKLPGFSVNNDSNISAELRAMCRLVFAPLDRWKSIICLERDGTLLVGGAAHNRRRKANLHVKNNNEHYVNVRYFIVLFIKVFYFFESQYDELASGKVYNSHRLTVSGCGVRKHAVISAAR